MYKQELEYRVLRSFIKGVEVNLYIIKSNVNEVWLIKMVFFEFVWQLMGIDRNSVYKRLWLGQKIRVDYNFFFYINMIFIRIRLFCLIFMKVGFF